MQSAIAITPPSLDFSSVTQLLEKGVKEGVFPGAALLIGKRGATLFEQVIGTRGISAREDEIELPMKFGTVFDIAALTNIVVTTTIFMRLVEEGRTDLNHRVARYLPGFNVLGKSPVTIGHLLSHTSGLPATAPYYEEIAKEHAAARVGMLTSKGARDFMITQLTRSALKYEPGTKQVFSDLGFMLLGHIIELLTGLSLERAAFKYVFQPFGLKTTSFIDLSMIRRRGIHPVTDLIAPTEECAWRNKILCGEVHDENAWAMGGIAGHSGVFSNAMDLHRFATGMLEAYSGKSDYVSGRTVRQFFDGPLLGFQGSWRFGWDAPSRENALLDTGMTEKAVGHNGTTGCSLWMEPELGFDVVFMTNRIHPTRSNRKIQGFRAELHKAILSIVR